MKTKPNNNPCNCNLSIEDGDTNHCEFCGGIIDTNDYDTTL